MTAKEKVAHRKLSMLQLAEKLKECIRGLPHYGLLPAAVL